MGYKEQVEGWELSIQGQVMIMGVNTWVGTGTRVFVGTDSAVCNTTLPSIGDTMYNPQNAESFVGIYCTEKNFKRTHSTDGNGLTCTVSYSSRELTSGSSAQREQDNSAGTFSADLVTLNIQGGTTWFWYTDNATDGATAAFPIAGILPDKFGGPCAENLPLTVCQIQRTKRIQFDDEADLEAWLPKIQTYGGKVNSVAMLGFNKGQVLLGGISGSMNNGKWDVDVVFICRKVSDPTITQDDWNYMPTAAEGAVTYHRPMKVVPLVSPGAGFLEADGQSWMYGYADIAQILDTSAPTTTPAP